MKSRGLAIFSVLVGLLAISGPVFAHHGAARWNTDEWATISGLVKEFDWQNPHPLLLLDVKSDKGAVETWLWNFILPTLWPGALGGLTTHLSRGSRSPFMGIRRRKDSPS